MNRKRGCFARRLAQTGIFESNEPLMRFGVIGLLITLFLSGNIFAQGGGGTAWGHFYSGVGAEASGGEAQGIFHAGGGGEALLFGGLGAAAELGYMAPLEGLGNGIGVFSPGVVYAFNREEKTVPFVTGGYTLFFREGTAHGFHFGVGLNHWIGERWGIRIEGRDQVMPEYNSHFIEARFAIVIR